MLKMTLNIIQIGLLISLCALLSACSQPQVYGSISMSKGFNNYNSGYGGGGGGGYGSVSIGGRIY